MIHGKKVAIALIAVGLIVGLWNATGTPQRAAVLGLIGSLAILVPPVRQMINNLPYHFLDSNHRISFERLSEEAYKVRLRTFVGHSWFDAFLYASGAVMLALSFWLQY